LTIYTCGGFSFLFFSEIALEEEAALLLQSEIRLLNTTTQLISSFSQEPADED
jgi:hypothetical protein